MATPGKALHVFTTKLASKRKLGEDSAPRCSVLKCFLANDSARCTVTSLRMKDLHHPDTSAETAIEAMSSKLTSGKDTIGIIPHMLLENVSKSFGNILDARLNGVLLLMLTNGSSERNIEAASLLASTNMSPISFASAETKFRPLRTDKWFSKEVGQTKAIILPFIFKAVIDVCILGTESVEVTITAPGTVVGSFVSTSPRIQSVEVTINPKACHHSMTNECDRILSLCLDTASDILRVASETNLCSVPARQGQEMNLVSRKRSAPWGSAA